MAPEALNAVDQHVDRERWSVLYRDAFPRVYRALVVALFDREAALDGLHDAFEEGLRKPPPDRRNMEGWLYRVALRKARRAWRRSARNVTLEFAPSTADGLDSTLDRLEIGRLLTMLTQRQREILVAHYYLGLRHEEIADALGIRSGTVAATINQAITRMRKVVNAGV
jgi:RNA polymerase sigma factor (sigma-70 family)